MKGRMICGFLPKHLIFKAVRLNSVADHQAFLILGTLIHELTKHLKRGEHTCLILVDTLAIAQDVLTQNEYEIDVGTQVGCNTQRVLHGDHGHHINVSTIHKHIARALLTNPRIIVQAIIQNQERTRIHVGVATTPLLVLIASHLDLHLTLDGAHNNLRTLLIMNESRRHHMLKELVGHLRAGDNCTHGEAMLGVKQNVSHQERLARILLSDNDDHRGLTRINLTTLLDDFNIELPQRKVRHPFV